MTERATRGGGVGRLGRNAKGYSGETLDIAAILSECTAAARAHGWTIEEIHPPTRILGFTRRSTLRPQALARVYLSTGIHGDEPAGPLAICRLLRENQWPSDLNIWLCPCLNPAGFVLNRRQNAEGVDLNRDYLEPKAPGTVAHIAWLRRQPGFDLCLCLHEDWESHGFYLYEQNPDRRPSLGEAIIARVAEVCPIDSSEVIEGRPAQNGIIRPNLDPSTRPQWPEAFFLITNKTRLSYTLEAPSDYPLSTRVEALVAAVNTALATLERHRAAQTSAGPS